MQNGLQYMVIQKAQDQPFSWHCLFNTVIVRDIASVVSVLPCTEVTLHDPARTGTQ